MVKFNNIIILTVVFGFFYRKRLNVIVISQHTAMAFTFLKINERDILIDFKYIKKRKINKQPQLKRKNTHVISKES